MTIRVARAWLDAGRLGARAPGCRKCACQEPTLGRSILPMPTTVGWGQQVFLTGNNREYFLCKPVIGFAGRASVAVQKEASFHGGHVASRCEKCLFHAGFSHFRRSRQRARAFGSFRILYPCLSTL